MYPATPSGQGLHQQAEQQLAAARRRHNIAVVLHLHYPELWDEMAVELAHLNGEYDLYVSLPENVDPAARARIAEQAPQAMLLEFPNRGRDMAPFLTVLKAIRPLGYGQVLKIHAKKSLHREDGDAWRQGFLDLLLGSPEQVERITDAFAADPKLGLLGPAGHWLAYRHYWGYPVSYPAHMRTLSQRLGVTVELDALHFFAGSMFWCRPEALDRLLDTLTPEQFDEELGQVDGTLAHEVERLLAGACQTDGWRVADTAHPEATPAAAHPYPFAQQSPPLPNDRPLEQAAVYQVAAQAAPEVAQQQRLRQWAKRIPGARRLYRYVKGRA
jgi:lipopolysaccharide biosynthesis protein